jgi:CII-binding regulator of phage lambda lysogenization HflD
MEENNKKIIVIQNGENKKTGNHLTLASYGKSVKKYKYWLLGISLGCAVLGFLGGKFILNPSRETMTTNIEINLALSKDKHSYLDGSAFLYTNIISENNINAVIASNEKFSKYDYETLMSKSAFSIQAKKTTTDGVETESTTNYVITTNPSAFSSESDARSFLRALINYEIDHAASAINSFTIENVLPSSSTDLNTYSFDSWITSLSQQYTYLDTTYKEMISLFTSSFSVDGSSLSSHYRDFTSYYTNNNFSYLVGELTTNKYVNIGTGTDEEIEAKKDEFYNLRYTYETQFDQIISQINTANEQVTKLTSIKTPTEEISQQILTLSNQVIELTSKKESMIAELKNIGFDVNDSGDSVTVSEPTTLSEDSYLYKLNNVTTEWKNGCISFRQKLTKFNTQCDTDTDNLSALYRKCYSLSNKNTIVVLEPNMGTISGHISNYLIAGVALVVAFALSSFIFAEVYVNSSTVLSDAPNKEEEAK